MLDFLLGGLKNWLAGTFLGPFLDGLSTAAFGFLLLGIIGLTILILSIVLDGLIDIFDLPADGPLSLIAISGFISAYGFGGLILTDWGVGSVAASLLAILTGLLGGGLAMWLTRKIKKIEGGASVEESSFEGIIGVVSLPIPEGGLGEISVNHKGENFRLSARSKVATAIGEKVVIESMINETSAFVVPLKPSSNEA